MGVHARIHFAAISLLVWSASALALSASPTDKAQGFGASATGGAGGIVVTVDNILDLQRYAKAAGKHVIYIKGVMGDAGSKTSKDGDRIVPTADKTFLGLPGATIKGGFDIKVPNIVIRNIAVWGPGANDIDGNDPIHIEGSAAKDIWIDHVLVSDGQDGNLDITNGATNVTVSWTKFSYTPTFSVNHQYCNLIGSSKSKTSDSGFLKTTIMNSYWADGVVERMPRVRFGEVHVVNNLIKTKTSNYGVRAGQAADILVEKNLYVGTKDPIEIFKDETGQKVKVTSDNLFVNTTGTKSGINETKVFTPPYTLGKLLEPATLESTVGDPADGAGPTIDGWGTASVSSHSGALGFSMIRRNGLWLMSNGTTEPLRIEILALDGRTLQRLTMPSGSRTPLQGSFAARVARITGTEDHLILPVPGF